MGPLLYFASPLLVTLATMVTTMTFLGRRGAPQAHRVARWLLLADLTVLALAWLLIQTAPDVTTSNGVCKDLTGFGEMYLLIFGSAVAGGSAWGTASLQHDSRAVRLVLYAAVALAGPYVIAFGSFIATACTWN